MPSTIRRKGLFSICLCWVLLTIASLPAWGGSGTYVCDSSNSSGYWIWSSTSQVTDICAWAYGSGKCGEMSERYYCGENALYCPTFTKLNGSTRQDLKIAYCPACYWFPDNFALGWIRPGSSGGDIGSLVDATGALGMDTYDGRYRWLLYIKNYEWRCPCNLQINIFSANPQIINPSTGNTTSFSWTIYDPANIPVTSTLNVAGRAFSGSGISVDWDGKDSLGRIVPPGTYTATLTATNTDGCEDSKSVNITVIAPPKSCSLDVSTN